MLKELDEELFNGFFGECVLGHYMCFLSYLLAWICSGFAIYMAVTNELQWLLLLLVNIPLFVLFCLGLYLKEKCNALGGKG